MGEVAVSLVLLVGAGLLLQSFLKLRQVDPGFDPEGVIVSKVSLSSRAYPDNPSRVRYFQGLLDELRDVPGVRFAGVTSTLPMDVAGIDFNLPYVAEGQPMRPENELPELDYRIISPGYLEAMGVEVVRGRSFTDLDRAETQRVIQINKTAAEQFWPGQDPIGKSITIFYINNVPWEVVGVVKDTRHHALSTPATAQFFVPLAQAEYLFGYMTIVAKTEAGRADVVDGMRAAAVRLDPKFPLHRIETAGDLMADTIARDRFAAVLIGAFALLALVLSAAGIYGVVAYQVARRTREIGLRMALGAARANVVSDVVKGAVGMALGGIVLGLAGSFAATRVLTGMLFVVTPLDVSTHVGVAALLLAVRVVASVVPAMRASSVDPVSALRSD